MATHKSIVNLSDFPLNEHHLSVLQRGLKFCLTPFHPNPGELKGDMDKLHRRVRQISFYDTIARDAGGSQNSSTLQLIPPTPVDLGDNLMSFTPFKHRKFKLKSTWRGPTGPQTLEAMIISNEQDFNERLDRITNRRSNVTPLERAASRNCSTTKT